MRRRAQLGLRLGLMAALAVTATCRPSNNTFYGLVYPCAGTPGECGTTEDGAPMTCFAAAQLGAASGFCAPVCDGTDVPGPDRPAPPVSASDEQNMCLTTGASLLRCHPSDDDPQRSTRACPAGLECMRTDLMADEGVCTTAPLCYPGVTCQTKDRPFCGGDLIGLYFAPSPKLHTDHLPCVKAFCHASGSACGPGEKCLQDVVRASSTPPDLCLPSCEDLHCPPNYQCWRRLTPAGPPVCMPALAGVRCADSQDCLVGDCLPTGEPGFSACSISCTSDDDCTLFDGPRGAFVCGPPLENGQRSCISDEIFTGTLCTDDSHCRPSEKCLRRSVGQGPTDIGYCQVPCAKDGKCQPRAGIRHTCLTDEPVPICFPGKVGVPCRADDECVGHLSCLLIPDDLDQADQPIGTPVCTLPCVGDDDCTGNPFTPSSWCNNGRCALKRNEERICPSDAACRSGMCARSARADDLASMASRCTKPSELFP